MAPSFPQKVKQFLEEKIIDDLGPVNLLIILW